MDRAKLPFHSVPFTSWLAENQAITAEEKRIREAALERFFQRPMSTAERERWRHTPLDSLWKTAFKRPQTESVETVLPRRIKQQLNADCLVWINGRLSTEISDEQALQWVQSPANALLQYEQELPRGADDSAPRGSAFIDLNIAHSDSAVRISIPAGVQLVKPLHLIYYNTQHDDPCCVMPQPVLSVGAGASVTLLETYAGDAGAVYWVNRFLRCHLAAGATLDYYHVQDMSSDSWYIGNTQITQARDSACTLNFYTLGACLSREDISIDLIEPGASCFCRGLQLPRAGQHMDSHLAVNHAVAHTTSQQSYKSVVAANGCAVFAGTIHVAENAQATVAEQQHDTLLLSSRAKVYTQPALDILADDVRCAHGATVGQIDAEALFYLQSRGLSERLALDILLHGFIETVVDQCQHRLLREHLLGYLEPMINQLTLQGRT